MEATSERQDLVVALAEMMGLNKSDPTVTADLFEAVGWETASADLLAGRVAVKRGDFGEVLATEAAEAFDSLIVPVRKLRYQIDPNQTLPGSDVLGFEFGDDGEISCLEFIESKYRTKPHRTIAATAHEQLRLDRQSGFATTVKFVAARLSELDPDLYQSFLRYLRSREDMETRHTVVITCDLANWSTSVADELEDVAEHLPDLWLRVFMLEDSNGLIDDAYAVLGWEPVDAE